MWAPDLWVSPDPNPPPDSPTDAFGLEVDLYQRRAERQSSFILLGTSALDHVRARLRRHQPTQAVRRDFAYARRHSHRGGSITRDVTAERQDISLRSVRARGGVITSI